MATHTEKSAAVSDALKKITYGFHILTTRQPAEDMTTRHDDYIAAGTVSWVSQISFEPPLVMVAVQRDSDLNETIQKSRHFAVNTLGKDGKELVAEFGKRTDVDAKGKRLDGYPYEEGQTGSPLLKQAISCFECELVEVIGPAEGDHALLIGRVVSAQLAQAEAEPLVEWETDFRYGG